MLSKSVVSIVKGTDPEEMMTRLLNHLGGVESLIRPGSTVVLKPNAGHEFGPETSVCTSPAVVGAAIKEIRRAKPKEIIVAEASAIGCDTMTCFEISGIRKAAEDAGADRIVDIKKEKDLLKMPIRDTRSNLRRVSLPRFLVEADHIVNLPIFKSHVSVVFTCALKNIKGLVSDKVHYQMHQTDLSAAIMDLWSVVKADLNIADLIKPGEGFGPNTTLPVDFGCLAASKDPVALDATVCRMVGLDTDEVAFFNPARERRFGNIEKESIEIRGSSIEEVYKKLWLPYMEGFEQWPEYDIRAEGACSSCQALLAYTLVRLKAVGEYDKNSGVTIVVGRTKEIPEGIDPKKLILMGDCVKKLRDKGLWVMGCPPTEPSTGWAIIDRKIYNGPEDLDFDPKERGLMEEEKLLEYARKKRREMD